MNKSDLSRNAAMLRGSLSKKGYMRWWHSFVGIRPDTGQRLTFFIEYSIMNPELGGSAPILGQHLYSKRHGLKPSYFMIKAGVFPSEDLSIPERQLHAFYPISALKAAKYPLVLQAGNCFYSENHIYGAVEVSKSEARHRSFMSDAGSMEWDLEVHKAVACHTGFISNAFFTALNALDSFWHGEGIRTFYRGSVTFDGVVYEVSPESSFGYADKHWGKRYNRPWLQLAACCLTSERTGKELKHSALAVDGCCPRFLWFPLKRRFILQLTYAGEDFEFSFARPGSFCRSRFKMKETTKRYIWHITAQNKNALVRISGCCRKEYLMPLKYEEPDGTYPNQPLLGGSAGYGTIQLFRRTDKGNQPIDTLTFENGFFAYGVSSFVSPNLQP